MSTPLHPLQRPAPNALPLHKPRKGCVNPPISIEAQRLTRALVDLYHSSPIAREEWRLSAFVDGEPKPEPLPAVDVPMAVELRRCKHCGAELLAAGRGFRRVYCSVSCSDKAYYLRHKEEKIAAVIAHRKKQQGQGLQQPQAQEATT